MKYQIKKYKTGDVLQKYLIKKGDTLTSISKQTNTPIQELVTANNISNPNLIFAGKTLLVPKTQSLEPKPAPSLPIVETAALKVLPTFTLPTVEITASRILPKTNKDIIPKTQSKVSLPTTSVFNEMRFSTPNIRTENDKSFKEGHSLTNSAEGMVLHHTGITDQNLNSVTATFQAPNSVSSHVLIGQDGKRRIFANPNQVTFHSGESEWNGRKKVNDFMLGVEFQGDTDKSPLTNEQIQSFIEYARPIILAYNIPIENIVTHGQVARGRKGDINEQEYAKVLDALVKTIYLK